MRNPVDHVMCWTCPTHPTHAWLARAHTYHMTAFERSCRKKAAADSPWPQHQLSPSGQRPRPQGLKQQSSPRHRKTCPIPCTPWTGKHTSKRSEEGCQSPSGVHGCENVLQERREIPQLCGKKSWTHHTVSSQCTIIMACATAKKRKSSGKA